MRVCCRCKLSKQRVGGGSRVSPRVRGTLSGGWSNSRYDIISISSGSCDCHVISGEGEGADGGGEFDNGRET